MPRLTAAFVKSADQPGKYSDGGGLLLDVRSATRKVWTLRVQRNGKRSDFSLGSAREISLADARAKAVDWTRVIKAGGDPRPKDDVPVTDRADGPMTFKWAAVALHAELIPTWKHGEKKHGGQWLATLEQHVFETIGDMPVADIDVPEMRAALMPVWLKIPETARRLRQRIGAVLDWAHANGHRTSEAPMRTLNRSLPRQPKRDGHHAAMPYGEVPDFILSLRSRVGWSRLALEFAILTAARSGEVRGATWEEMDFADKVWTVPADRMKAGRPHRVPLSAAALDVLKRASLIRLEGTDFVFPGQRGGMLSDMSLSKIMKLEERGDATPHGFRSSFRDWAAEKSGMPGEWAEAALAHVVKNRVEAAYRRTDYIEQRRRLMDAWGAFATSKTTARLTAVS